MPAPDHLTLLDLETALEDGIKAALAAQGIACYLQREDVTKKVPCVELQFSVGAQPGTRTMRSGTVWINGWNFTLACSIKTPRKATSQPVIHADLRAAVRLTFQPGSGLLTAEHLPYHCLPVCLEAGTVPQVLTEGDLDESVVTFAGVVSIRDDAWP